MPFKRGLRFSKTSITLASLLIERNEFIRPDFDKIKDLLKEQIIFDGRKHYDGEHLKQRGFEYQCF
jgi:UDPglucose 6-dehydrogenase